LAVSGKFWQKRGDLLTWHKISSHQNPGDDCDTISDDLRGIGRFCFDGRDVLYNSRGKIKNAN
jgi:hypothetical protein